MNLENKLIPIIILNYNGEKDTIECLQSIILSKRHGFYTILIDNGSTQNSVTFLKFECNKLFKDIISLKNEDLSSVNNLSSSNFTKVLTEETLVFIECEKNQGFSKGNNIGITFAEHNGADWVLLLNNDTIIVNNTLVELKQFISNHSAIVAVSPQIRYYDQKEKMWFGGGKLTYFGSRKYRFTKTKLASVTLQGFSLTTIITGCALLFNYKKTGILSEDFFFGEEDYEFSLRLAKMQLRMACVYDSVVYHKVGSTRKESHNYLASLYVYYINRLINTRNYYSEIRWNITKILAFIYLPILLYRNAFNPILSIGLIKKINSYIANNSLVTQDEFLKSITLKYFEYKKN